MPRKTELGAALWRSMPVHCKSVAERDRDRVFIRLAVVVAALSYVGAVLYGVS